MKTIKYSMKKRFLKKKQKKKRKWIENLEKYINGSLIIMKSQIIFLEKSINENQLKEIVFISDLKNTENHKKNIWNTFKKTSQIELIKTKKPN